jgi:aryl-alcohol dehydrogenase-like predicted oxidoreductase
MTFGEADAQSFMHGVGCSEQTAFDIMDRALEAGVDFFDTADVYGQDGLTERVVGRWFAARGRRDEVVLASKFRFRMGPGPHGTGASRLRVVRAVEASLKRLQTDRIDLYQVHMQDVDTPEEETLRALEDLRTAGKILYAGASNYAAYRLMHALDYADARSSVRYSSLQARYSLLVRDVERELSPLCVAHGVGMLAYSPLAGGFLAGKYVRGRPPPNNARLASWKDTWRTVDNDRGWRVLTTLEGAARELGATPAQVALAWVMGRPGVASVIFGARSPEQLSDNLRAAELSLPSEVVTALDEASAFELGYPYDFIRRVQGRW